MLENDRHRTPAFWIVLVQDNTNMDYFMVNEQPMDEGLAIAHAIAGWPKKCEGISPATRALVTWVSDPFLTFDEANEVRNRLMRERYRRDGSPASRGEEPVAEQISTRDGVSGSRVSNAADRANSDVAPPIDSPAQALRLLATVDSRARRAATLYFITLGMSGAGSQNVPIRNRVIAGLSQAWQELPRPRDGIVKGVADAVRTDRSLLTVEIAAAALALEGEDGATEVVGFLKSPDVNVRLKAAGALELLGTSARWAVPALIRSLSKEFVQHDAHAVLGTLGRIGGDEAIKALRRFCQIAGANGWDDLVAIARSALVDAEKGSGDVSTGRSLHVTGSHRQDDAGPEDGAEGGRNRPSKSRGLDRDLCIEVLLEHVAERGELVFEHSVLVASPAGSTRNAVYRCWDYYWPYVDDFGFVGPFRTLEEALSGAWQGEILNLSPEATHEIMCTEWSSAELARKCVAPPGEFRGYDLSEYELSINRETWICRLDGDAVLIERRTGMQGRRGQRKRPRRRDAE